MPVWFFMLVFTTSTIYGSYLQIEVTDKHFNMQLKKNLSDSKFCCGMWGTQNYEQPPYTYNIHQLTALSRHTVTNLFWHFMNSAPQEHKNLVLHHVLDTFGPDADWLAYRLNVAAAIYAGANLTVVQAERNLKATKLLSDAITIEDLPLITLLLQHGANVHEVDLGQAAIYRVKRVSIAKLLIEHGALTTGSQIAGLLHRIMCKEYEPALIPLYRQHGFDPMQQDNYGLTPLTVLALHPQEHMPQKATLLLDGLSTKQCHELITHQNNMFNQNILDIIATKQKTVPPQDRLYLDEFYIFCTHRLTHAMRKKD